MPTPYNPKAIANYFLDKGKGTTQMKLHKLIYFAQGWNLAIRDEPLIDEAIEAWDYGPVVPSVYHEFKDLGSSRIDRKAASVGFVRGDTLIISSSIPTIDADDFQTRKLLDRVWEVYGRLTAVQLSQMTHEPGTPWTITRQANSGLRGIDIPNKLIQEYFKARLEKQTPVHA